MSPRCRNRQCRLQCSKDLDVKGPMPQYDNFSHAYANLKSMREPILQEDGRLRFQEERIALNFWNFEPVALMLGCMGILFSI